MCILHFSRRSLFISNRCNCLFPQLLLVQTRRKMRKTPMSDPVARYASHKQAWSRNIFLKHGSSKRPYTPKAKSNRRVAASPSSIDLGVTLKLSPSSPSSPTVDQRSLSAVGIVAKRKKKKKGFVVPTNKRRDGVRSNIRSKMRMVRTMAAQAGKRGGNRGASRAKQPSTFRIPSSKKRQALRWEIRGKMLSPA
mgnify:CR=1 FL=1